jgi:hypothetical protein
MAYNMRVFVTAHRGAPMEDLGVISVSPKPVRSEMVHFLYRGDRDTHRSAQLGEATRPDADDSRTDAAARVGHLNSPPRPRAASAPALQSPLRSGTR